MSLKGRHIFIIEDNLNSLNILLTILNRNDGVVSFDQWHYDTKARLLRCLPLDVILLDLKVLLSDGAGVLRAIHKVDSTCTILVLNGEGEERKSILDQCLCDWARLCLQKPFQPAEILQHVAGVRVERAVRKLQGSREDTSGSHLGR